MAFKGSGVQIPSAPPLFGNNKGKLQVVNLNLPFHFSGNVHMTYTILKFGRNRHSLPGSALIPEPGKIVAGARISLDFAKLKKFSAICSPLPSGNHFRQPSLA